MIVSQTLLMITCSFLVSIRQATVQANEPVCSGYWTRFYDRDDPSGTGDWEVLSHLRPENPDQICENPTAIYAETLNGVSAEKTGEVFYNYDTDAGFVCRNADQSSNGYCKDYRVKFCCPAWTKFFDRDDPSGTGDWEDLSNLRPENPDQICENPTAIYAETLSGVPAVKTEEVFYKYDTDAGFVCQNADQSDGYCNDYRVKFMCPPWTKFFDRDDPSGTGDWENLSNLRRENPDQICENPTAIYAETLNGVPAEKTGEVFYKYDTDAGFVCRNVDQSSNGDCKDYRVTFLC